MRSPRRPARTPPAASQTRAAPDPRILTGWSGASPHVLRFPPRAFLRFPVCPPGSPPSPAFPGFPCPAFSGSSPSAVARVPVPLSVSLRVPLPLGNLHHSATAARFRRRWSRAARAKVTSPAATPRLDLAVIRPAPQMGSGWARWMPPRIARYERPRAQGTAAPEPPRSNIFRLILGLPQAASERRCSSSVSVQLLVAVRKPELIPASATCGTGTVPLRAEYRAVHGQVRDACCAMLQQRLIRSRGTRRFRAMPGTTVRVCYLTAE